MNPVSAMTAGTLCGWKPDVKGNWERKAASRKEGLLPLPRRGLGQGQRVEAREEQATQILMLEEQIKMN